MNLASVSLEELQRTLDVFKECDGNQTRAAQQIGLSRSAFQDRLKKAYKAIPKEKISADVTRVLVIPDAHVKPGMALTHLDHIGDHVQTFDPDVLVVMGDFGDLGSCCHQIGNETYSGKLKPTFLNDVAAINDGLKRIKARSCHAQKYYLTGNHENRLYKYEEHNPEIYGMMQAEFEWTVESHGFVISPFGKYVDVAGVDFVHIPLNIMGKPVGGKFVGQTVGRESVRDVVLAHTHRKSVTSTPKLGQNVSVKVVETGCCLPWGVVEDYAELNQSGWWWGITELLIRNGRIEAENFIPMFELERLYG